jgi:hypothetical protein
MLGVITQHSDNDESKPGCPENRLQIFNLRVAN